MMVMISRNVGLRSNFIRPPVGNRDGALDV
jgi:hypothetical protein